MHSLKVINLKFAFKDFTEKNLLAFVQDLVNGKIKPKLKSGITWNINNGYYYKLKEINQLVCTKFIWVCGIKGH